MDPARETLQRGLTRKKRSTSSRRTPSWGIGCSPTSCRARSITPARSARQGAHCCSACGEKERLRIDQIEAHLSRSLALTTGSTRATGRSLTPQFSPNSQGRGSCPNEDRALKRLSRQPKCWWRRVLSGSPPRTARLSAQRLSARASSLFQCSIESRTSTRSGMSRSLYGG